MANRYGLGAAQFNITVSNDQALAAFAQTEAAARRSSAKIAAAIDTINNLPARSAASALAAMKAHNDAADKAAIAARKMADEQSKAFGGMAKSAISSIGAIAGVTVALGTLNAVLEDTAKKTYAAQQATFQLNAVYKETAGTYREFTNNLANSTKLLNTDLQKGVSILGNLQKNYGFTSDQIQNLTKIAVDAAAVHGVPLLDAFKSIEAAMRGEGEAAEKLGFTLNAQFVKNSAVMTDQQRKMYFSLTDVTRAQIIYNEAIRQGGPYQGAAVDRTKTAIGVIDALTVSLTKLQIKLGELATGPIVGIVSGLTVATDQAGKFIDMLSEIEKHTGLPPWIAALLGLGALTPGLGAVALPGLVAAVGAAGPVTSMLEQRRKARGNELVDNDAEKDVAAAISAINDQKEADRRAKRIQAEKKLTDDLKIELEKREKEVAKATEQGIKEVDKAVEAENRLYESIRANLEAEKHARQEANKDRRDNALKTLEVEYNAERKRFEQAIDNLQNERDSKLEAAKDTHSAEVTRLEREGEAVRAAADEQIRQEEIKRDNRLKIAEETRDGLIEITRQEKEAALDAIKDEIAAAQRAKELEVRDAEDTKKSKLDSINKEEASRQKSYDKQVARNKLAKDNAIRNAEAEKEAQLKLLDDLDRARDRARDLEDRRIDDETEAQLRAIDDREQANTDSYANQEEALRRATETQIRALEELANAEEDRHNANIQRIDDEERQLDDAHDEELRRIKEEGDARLREIDDRINATDQLEKAYNNQKVVAGLQDKLTVARRKGDPDEIARIEKEIQDELLKQQFDAQKDSLKATKDNLKDELDAEEQAAKDRYDARKDALDAEKRLEQETYKTRKELIDREKDDIREQLADALDALQDRSLASSRATDLEKQLIKDRTDALKRSLADQRYAEDEALRIRKEAINSAYDAERAKIDDHYDNPVKGVFARLAQQSDKTKAEFDKRKKTVDAAYDDERRRIEDHYDDPQTGVFAKLHQQQTETERAFDARTRTINAAYEAEQDAIKATYDAEDTGSIPAIKRAVRATEQQLELRKEAIDAAYEAEQRAIKKTYDDLITQQNEARKQAEEVYNARRDKVNEVYELEQKAIYKTFDDPLTGAFALQKKAHDAHMQALEDQKRAWQQWKDQVTERINEAQGGLETFINKIKELEAEGILIPGSVVDGRDGGDRGRGGGSSGISAPRQPQTSNPGGGEPYTIGFGFNQLYDPPQPGLPARHRGVDLRLPGEDGGRGKPVGAFSDATIIARTDEEDNGMGLLTQRKSDGLYEFYGHFDSRSVNQGDEVKRGDRLGTLGGSGTENWPHLHYEVRRGLGGDAPGNTIDPVPYMNGLRNTIDGGGDPLESDIDYENLTVLRPLGPNGPAIILGIREKDWYGKAKKYARRADFSEPTTFAKQMRLESDNFSPDVISGKRKSSAGAIGIAQFMPDTAAGLGIDPYDPIDSLKGAAKYMHHLEMRYDGVRNALWAYNAGEGNLQDGFMPSETREYLRKLDKYRNGTMINEPTLMLGLKTGEAGIAGETGQPERLLGVNATQQYDGNGSSGTQTMHIPITLGNNVIEDLWIQGIKLSVKSGRTIGLPGIRVQ